LGQAPPSCSFVVLMIWPLLNRLDFIPQKSKIIFLFV
jgi:hypothetical protein